MNGFKTYTVKATAEIEIDIRTDKPEHTKNITKGILNSVCKHAEVDNVSIREADSLPRAFTKQLYDNFTGGKG